MTDEKAAAAQTICSWGNLTAHQKKTLLIGGLLVLLLGLSLPAWALQNKRLTAAQAKDHVGERATVCGTVASAKFAEKTKGSPTFLDFEKPFPRQLFTAVIWGDDRPKFGQPEVEYQGKKICVTGEIKLFRKRPEIVVTEKNQITGEWHESLP